MLMEKNQVKIFRLYEHFIKKTHIYVKQNQVSIVHFPFMFPSKVNVTQVFFKKCFAVTGFCFCSWQGLMQSRLFSNLVCSWG